MPELTESIETLNNRLRDHFGIDTILSYPIYRIVWANDQTEKVLRSITESGIELVSPQLMEVKKYSWIKDRYILEKLVLVPVQHLEELADIKVSYECLFVFENEKIGYLPPKWEVCKFVIDTVHAAMGKSTLAKYKVDPEESMKKTNEIYEYLCADETDVTDALARKEGIVVPSNYNSEKPH